MIDVKVDVKGLEKLIKALKTKPPVGRIGVLGSNGARKDSFLTNAGIGAAHEFGTSRTPQRSFLRVPLIDNLTKELQKSGLLDKDTLKAVLATGNLRPWVEQVVVVGEGVVLGAFDSGGYGKWPPSDMRYKKNHQTLVETQQLRNSITSEVKDSE